MLRYLPVRRIHARQVLDSRGTPTVEVEATVGEGIIGIEGYTARAIVPSGASTGRFEAVELRDGEKGYYVGLSVRKAVENVNIRLAEAILGENALNQVRIDELLIKADGTENKSSAGANATLGVSMAVARAAAMALRIPLYQYLGGCHTRKMPVPMMNILNGGKHADNTVDLQEFMIMPCGAGNFEDGIRMCVEIYQFLKILLREKGLSTAVGDEGGFAPDLKDSRDVLRLILEAVEKAGYEPGKDIFIAIDAAASELYDEEQGVYRFPGESKMKAEEVLRDAAEMIDYYEELLPEIEYVKEQKAAPALISDRNKKNSMQMGNLVVENGQVYWCFAPKTGGSYSGTGDLFASVLSAGLVKRMSMMTCVELAVKFLSKAIAETVQEGTDRNDGVCFEKYLEELCKIEK